MSCSISGSWLKVSKVMRHLCHTNHNNDSHISATIRHTGTSRPIGRFHTIRLRISGALILQDANCDSPTRSQHNLGVARKWVGNFGMPSVTETVMNNIIKFLMKEGMLVKTGGLYLKCFSLRRTIGVVIICKPLMWLISV